MSKLSKFNKNGEHIGVSCKELTPRSVGAYIEQYGNERALGYLDCVKDIIERLDFSVRDKKLQDESLYGPKEEQAFYVVNDHIIEQLKISRAFELAFKKRENIISKTIPPKH